MCNLTIWDTSGSQNFDTVRPLSYGEADVFIICYKVGYTNYKQYKLNIMLR